MAFKTTQNIDSGETEYIIETTNSIQSNWSNLSSSYELKLDQEQIQELYYSLKEIVCE